MNSLPSFRRLFAFTLLGAALVPAWLSAQDDRDGENPAGSPGGQIHLPEADVGQAMLYAFDDRAIAATGNLQLAMEAPEKYPGNPVLPIGRAGQPDEWQLRFYGTILWNQGKFRMWYLAASYEGFVMPLQGGDVDFRGWRVAYAESPDGIHWTKPDLNLMEFRGSWHNNLVGMPAGFHGYHALVRFEPEEPDPSRRFKMMAEVRLTGEYVIPGGGPEGAYVPLYSSDGLSWRLADELVPAQGKVISGDFHLVTSFEAAGFYKWQGLYYLSGQNYGKPRQAAAMAPPGRHVQLYHSADLIHWSEAQTMGFARQGQFGISTALPLEAGRIVYADEQTHEGASVWNRGNVLLALTGFWHGNSDWTKITHDLGFLTSDDGLHFREPQPEFIFAHVGEKGRDWDYGGLAQAQAFANVGDKTFVWYGAPMDQSEGPRTGHPFLREGGVGLLTLGRDRFGGLSTREPDRDAVLVTEKIRADRPVKLWINAEGVGPDSRLRVELLDEFERPLAGFAGPSAAVLTHSGLRTPVTWSAAQSAAAISGPFKIQIRFEGPERNAIRLYAIYLGQ